MKIGICLLLLASASDPLSKESIPIVKKAGFDYAEISLARIYALSEQELSDYEKLFEESGLAVEAFNNGIPDGVKIVGRDVTTEDWNQFIKRAVSLARRFGVKVITTSAPHITESFSREDWLTEGKGQYIAFLRKYADECAKYGIQIALEPICKEEQGFVNTVLEAKELIELTGRDNISIVPDLFHMRAEKDDISKLPELAGEGFVRHLHFADSDSRRIPFPENCDEYKEIIMPMLDAGFDGRISIEAFSENIKEDAPRAAASLDFCK